VFNACLDAYISTNSSKQKVLKLREEMAQAGVLYSAETYILLLSFHSATNDEVAMHRLVDMMGEPFSGISADEVLNTVLADCLKGHLMKSVQAILSTMRYAKVTLSVLNFTGLIHAYGKVGQVDKAENLWQEAKHQGIPLTVVAYNALLGVYTKAGDLEKIQHTRDAMATAKVAEDVTTYSTLLRYAANTQDYLMLEAFRLEMLEAGLMPNIFTFETLIDAYNRSNNVHQLKQMQQAMQQTGVPMTAAIAVSLIEGYTKAQLVELVASVLQAVHGDRISLTLETYYMIIDFYGSVQPVDVGLLHQVWNLMQDQGPKPDPKVFDKLIAIYSREKAWDKVQLLRGHFKGSGVKPTIKIFSALISKYN